jgi:CNP1-like family
MAMLRARLALLALWLTTGSIHAQLVTVDPDWSESAVPPPPNYEVTRLLSFDVPGASTLKYGIDPNTITFTAEGLVRYVVVASSANGAVNAMYEAIRCSTGEYKTYARRTLDSEWKSLAEPTWRSMQESQHVRYAFRLAQQGVCTGRAPASSVAAIVRNLKSPASSNR